MPTNRVFTHCESVFDCPGIQMPSLSRTFGARRAQRRAERFSQPFLKTLVTQFQGSINDKNGALRHHNYYSPRTRSTFALALSAFLRLSILGRFSSTSFDLASSPSYALSIPVRVLMPRSSSTLAKRRWSSLRSL